MKLSISTKISLLVILLIIITVAPVGFLVFKESEGLLIEKSTQILSAEAHTHKHDLLSSLDYLKRDVQFLSNLPCIETFKKVRSSNKNIPFRKNSEYKKCLKHVEMAFQQLIKTRSNYYQIRIIGVENNGKEIIRVDRKANSIFTIPYGELQQKGGRYYFEEAIKMREKEVYFSRVDLNIENNIVETPYVPVIRAATPLYINEKTSFIVIINMRLKNIFDTIPTSYQKGTTTAYLINGYGDYLIHPDIEKTFGFVFNKNHKIDEQFPTIKKILNNRLTMWQKFEDSISINKDDKLLQFLSIDYDTSNRFNFMAIILEIPKTVILERIDSAKKQSIILVFSIILIAIIAAVTLTNYLISPLIKISNAAKDFAYGNFKAYLPTDNEDEIGELARSIKDMGVQIEERTNKLVRSQEELEIEVEERTADLQEALYKAKKANSTKEEFLTNMSHEVRTPMNGIIGILNLLSNTNITEKQMEYIDAIRTSSKALLNIINDILDFTNIEAGKINFEYVPFNLKDLTEDIVISLRSNINKSISLDFEWKAGSFEYVVSDPWRMSQIISNLVNNAIKFTNEGFVKVSIEKKVLSDDDCEYTISIEDSGIGIPEEKMQAIFEKFGQVEDHSFRKFGGAGLGLAICSELLKIMGGSKIEVSSEVGVGSKFWFTLEIPIASEEVIEKLQENNQTDKKLENIFKGTRVLLAEDNRINVMVMTDLLEKYGCTFSVASNGYEAAQIFAKEKFDLILMDCRMPEMDGYEATEAIRKMEQKEEVKETPIIALTANAIKEDEERCLTIGMNGYIRKPIDEENLVKSIKKWINPKNKGKNKKST